MSNNSPAFQGSGGFQTQQQFDSIKKLVNTIINKHDFTGSVKVEMDVRIFNALIGIEKDENNIEIVTVNYYNNDTNLLKLDALELTAERFLAGINNIKTQDVLNPESNIKDVGKYVDFYRSFANYVAGYFGLPDAVSQNTQGQGISKGVSTLYSGEYDFLPNGGIFDNLALLNMLNGDDVLALDASGNPTGGKNQKLLGSIELKNITSALRNAVDTNCFGNRNRSINSDIITASNDGLGITSSTNYGVTDGFYDNDVIFVGGDGILLTMELGIDPVFPSNPIDNIKIKRSIGNSIAITLKNHSKCYVRVNQSSTNNTIIFEFNGYFSNILFAKRTENELLFGKYESINQYSNNMDETKSFIDSNLIPSTKYFYSFIPVDADGYKGITKIIESITNHI